MFDKVGSYLQAGLDESLAQFMKGVFCSALVAMAGYALKHATNFSPNVEQIVSYFILAVPGLISFWNWVTTTASDSNQTTTNTTATPVQSIA